MIFHNRRVYAVLFWLAIVVTFALAMTTQLPKVAGATNAEVQQAVDYVLTVKDKTQHFAAFAVLAGLALAAWPALNVLAIVVGLSAYGALIEFAQSMPFIRGDAEWTDWIADIGAVLAVVAASLYKGRRRRPS